MQFIEKFQEVKEATRSSKSNGTISGGGGGGGGGGGVGAGGGGGAGGAVSSSSGPASATASPLTSRAKIQDPAASDINAVTSGEWPPGRDTCGKRIFSSFSVIRLRGRKGTGRESLLFYGPCIVKLPVSLSRNFIGCAGLSWVCFSCKGMIYDMILM